MRLRGFTILAVLLLVAACEKPDDLAVIRAAVDDIAQRAQAHDVSGMMAHADEAFVAAPGNRDEQGVRPVLLVAFRRYGKFRVAYPAPGIRLHADGATADVSVPFVIVREGRTLPDAQLAEIVDDPVAWVAEVTKVAGDPYQLDLEFRKRGGDWRVVRAEIKGVRSLHGL